MDHMSQNLYMILVFIMTISAMYYYFYQSNKEEQITVPGSAIAVCLDMNNNIHADSNITMNFNFFMSVGFISL